MNAVKSQPRVPRWQRLKGDITGLSPIAAATNVLHLLEVQSPPVDVERIARNLEIAVHIEPTPWSGAVRSTQFAAAIWVNSNDHPLRRRFTLAHEIAHLLRHPTGEMFRDQTYSDASDPREIEANKFAAHLLIPLWMLEPIATGPRRRTTSELAELFQVSAKALETQLDRLLLG